MPGFERQALVAGFVTLFVCLENQELAGAGLGGQGAGQVPPRAGPRFALGNLHRRLARAEAVAGEELGDGQPVAACLDLRAVHPLDPVGLALVDINERPTQRGEELVCLDRHRLGAAGDVDDRVIRGMPAERGLEALRTAGSESV